MITPNLTATLKKHAIDFAHERNGIQLASVVKGFFCSNQYPSSIQVLGAYDVREGDYLIHHSTNKRCFIDDVKPLSKTSSILHYQTDFQLQQKEQQSTRIHIETINGPAIVGSQQNATINIGASFDEIRKYITDSKNIEEIDKESLTKLANTVEAVINNDMQISNGTFSKFSALAEKHSPIIAAIMQPLTNWLLGMR